MTRVPCVLCGIWCTPMADYDTPVCARCDANHEAALLRLWEAPPPPARPRLAPLDGDTDRDLRELVRVLADMMAGVS